MQDGLQTNRTAGAGPILENEYAFRLRCEPINQKPRRKIDGTSSRERNDDTNGSRGPFLRSCGRRNYESDHYKANQQLHDPLPYPFLLAR